MQRLFQICKNKLTPTTKKEGGKISPLITLLKNKNMKEVKTIEQEIEQFIQDVPKMTKAKTVVMIKGNVQINESQEGETLEQQIERMLTNKEPLGEGQALIYTERKDGVRAETNIRTDRWEVAIDAMDKVSKSYQARREERMKMRINKDEENKNDGEAKSIQGTSETSKAG